MEVLQNPLPGIAKPLEERIKNENTNHHSMATIYSKK